MTDVCFTVRDAVEAAARSGEAPTVAALATVPRPYLVSTVHRAENTDDPQRLAAIVAALAALPVPVLLLAHPRLTARCQEFGIDLGGGSLVVSPPLSYPGMVEAVLGSAGVVTDSGGLQKEAFLLGRPCTTLRTETEWVETLDGGWNVLAPGPADHAGLAALVTRPAPAPSTATPYGDGHAAQAVVKALLEGPPPA